MNSSGRSPQLVRLLIGTVTILLVWVLLAWFAARALVVNAPIQRPELLVVFSGSSAYVERAHLAAKLFHEGAAPRILLTNDNERSGWSEAQQINPLFVERAQDELRRDGVPSGNFDVMPDYVTGGTHGEAVAVRDYATRTGVHSLLFVTSPYHTRRALWTVRRVFQGSDIQVGIVTMEPGVQTPRPATWWLSGVGWNAVAVEYVKLAYYLWKYR